MQKYKKNYQSESMNALKLALIITGSVVAAAGIIMILMHMCKKKHHRKAHGCCCGIENDVSDSWDIDEDILNELELDDDEECCGGQDDGIANETVTEENSNNE